MLPELTDIFTHGLDNKCHSINIFFVNDSTCVINHVTITIEQNILIDELQCYGFRTNVKDWLTNYVIVNPKHVSIKIVVIPIRTGVPQGFILGPLLFILYLDISVNVS